MESISEAFTRHHEVCDELWAHTELQASEGRWAEAEQSLARFLKAMAAHLAAEENVLFTAFEAVTGTRGGPTQVMRAEHDQLRGLFKRLEIAVARQDAVAFSGAGETMLILLQQHNLKEENVLYPMCDRVLGGDVAVLARLDAQLLAEP